MGGRSSPCFIPVVHISSYSLPPRPLFSVFLSLQLRKMIRSEVGVFVCAPACEICTTPFTRSAVAEDKRGKSKVITARFPLTLPFSPLLCAPVCVYMCLHGRESVCNSVHRARLCTNHGAHFSSKHTCRHLYQSERCACVCLCAFPSASWHSSVFRMSH